MERKKVAILYLCSGTYSVFWRSFYQNYSKYFLKGSDVHFHVFTDLEDIVGKDDENVHLHYTDAKGWPGASLMRYHFFCDIEEELKGYDYCFFMNACMLCVENVTEEELFVDEGNVLVVEHCVHMQNRLLYGLDEANRMSGFERNPESTAFVPYGEEKTYVTGAFNGGSTSAFLDMAKEIKADVDKDIENGIMACVFDESYLNHYIYKHDNFVLKDSSFCHPEVFRIPAKQKVMIMEKVNLLDVYSVKHGDDEELNSCKRQLIGEQEKKTVLQKLILAQKKGISIDLILRDKGYNSIAIFGYKDMGAFINELLDDSDINVAYIIDNFLNRTQTDIALIKEEQINMMSDVDCILVAHPPLYYRILDKYGENFIPPIVSIDHLAHECYMRSLEK